MKKGDIGYEKHLLKMKLNYHEKIKNNIYLMEKRRLYYKEYYEKNKDIISLKRKIFMLNNKKNIYTKHTLYNNSKNKLNNIISFSCSC